MKRLFSKYPHRQESASIKLVKLVQRGQFTIFKLKNWAEKGMDAFVMEGGLSTLMSKFNSSYEIVSSNAVLLRTLWALGKFAQEGTVSALTDSLDENLSQICSSGLSSVVKALSSPSEEVQEQAAFILGQISCVGALFWVSWVAEKRLTDIRRQGGIEPLVRLLECVNPSVQLQALSVLTNLSVDSRAFLRGDGAVNCRDSIYSVGGLKQLVAMLSVPREQIQTQAAWVLGNLAETGKRKNRR